MPLKLPNLDDRTYTDLVEEARALIPVYAPREWTNHNESDPGITLIELFAFLTETLIYRANRVTDASHLAFLKLLKGSKWTPSPTETLEQQLRAAVKELREENRAVTCADFERLAGEADAQVARARCLPRRNLESENESASSIDKPGHVSVVIVPGSAAVNPAPSAALVQKVKDYLEPRRLLTTQVHVVGPRYFAFDIRLALRLKPDAVADTARISAIKALKQFLDPLAGGETGEGWPFGRNVFISEIYQLLDTLPGIDYVSKIDSHTDEFVAADPNRLRRNDQKELVAVKIQPNELIDIQRVTFDLRIPTT